MAIEINDHRRLNSWAHALGTFADAIEARETWETPEVAERVAAVGLVIRELQTEIREIRDLCDELA